VRADESHERLRKEMELTSYRAMCTATKLMNNDEAGSSLIVISFVYRHVHGDEAHYTHKQHDKEAHH
jgi:hypothetical protein